MPTLAASIASTILENQLDSFHALAVHADSATLALAFVLVRINREL